VCGYSEALGAGMDIRVRSTGTGTSTRQLEFVTLGMSLP
jgi:hypothetical protein